MARVVFTQNLRRHVDCPPTVAAGATVREVLDAVFRERDRLRGYIVDEQARLRPHVMVFVDGQEIADRVHLTDAAGPASEIYVMQALSGG